MEMNCVNSDYFWALGLRSIIIFFPPNVIVFLPFTEHVSRKVGGGRSSSSWSLEDLRPHLYIHRTHFCWAPTLC